MALKETKGKSDGKGEEGQRGVSTADEGKREKRTEGGER